MGTNILWWGNPPVLSALGNSSLRLYSGLHVSVTPTEGRGKASGNVFAGEAMFSVDSQQLCFHKSNCVCGGEGLHGIIFNSFFLTQGTVSSIGSSLPDGYLLVG